MCGTKTLLLVCALLISDAVAGEVVHYAVPIGGIEGVPEQIAEWPDGYRPRAVLEGAGEAYVDLREVRSYQPGTLRGAMILVQAPKGTAVRGKLMLPDRVVPFVVTAEPAAQWAEPFAAARRDEFEHRIRRGYAGTAYWRLQVEPRALDERSIADRRAQRNEMRDTYELLSGGRAVAENLQLRRGLMTGKCEKETVPIDSLTGITVREFDWSGYLEGAQPDPDPLAARIPADQHAFFFPSVRALVDVLDMAERHGLPALQTIEVSAQDTGIRARYERELSLNPAILVKQLGPDLVTSVAITGSDPFFREGTDVAVLFASPKPDALATLLRDHRAGAARLGKRKDTSHQFRVGDVVVVTNSAVQKARLGNVAESMAALDEYKFFRSRYPRAGETAFFMLTDGAIRRWCSPRWRIAMSRRLRALAALTTLEAEQHAALVKGAGVGAKLANDFDLVDLGEVTLTSEGPRSSIYGTPRRLTPIAELRLTNVTEGEANGYNEWRDGYQRNWSRYFDPIGVQVKRDETGLEADVTVMPLIVGSEYRRYIRIVGDSRIQDGDADPHADALFHMVMAFDHDSEFAKMFGSMFPSWPGMKPRTNPLSWVGRTVSFSIDRDPVLQEALASENPEEFMESNIGRLPILMHVDVENGLMAGLFMSGLRRLVEQTAPGYTKWGTRKHGDVTYVRIESGEQMDDEFKDFALHYATLKQGLILAVNEDVLKRAIDRQKNPPQKKQRWLGDHLAGRAHRELFLALEALAGDDGYRGLVRQRCWKNLPILNEWRRLYPYRDPVEVHERITGVRLVCPGGGRYVWNGTWHTFESTHFGHPSAPKRGPADCLPFPGYKLGEFGVTFETEGVRARVRLSK
ncbi:MAG: hypothetical protein AAGD14_05580 [Planctomycetota bacterium]